MLRTRSILVAALGVLLLSPGCTTLSQLAALRQVDFALDRVSNGLVAGVNLDNVRGGNVGAVDLARLGAAAARGSVPLSFTVHVGASNPAENPTPAQLVSLDWTLFLDGQQTVSGIYNDERTITPGTTTDLPINVQLDLVQFFGRNVGDLAQLVGNLAGVNTGSSNVIRLDAQPTVTTQFGRIRYPGVISIEFPVGTRN